MSTKIILDKLNIKKNESQKIGLLLIQSVFIGIFISFYYSFASALFLKENEVKELPVAYMLSGLLGFLASFLFSKAQEKFNVSRVMSGLLFTILFLFSFFKLYLDNWNEGREQIVYLIFILFVPISALTVIGFGAITIKMFDLRQGKRLFPIISAGEVIASLLAFISIPFLLKKFNHNGDDTSFLLYFAIFGVILAVLFQFFIGKKYDHLFSNINTSIVNTKKKINFRMIINNKYYSSLIILSIISVLSFMFIEFSFLQFSKSRFLTKVELTKFLSQFYAIIKLTELIFKTFISGGLIQKYGLKFGLGILPMVLIPITFYTIYVILSDGADSDIAFICIAVMMLFSMILKKSFEVPTFSLLFQPLDSVTKISLQTLVIGKAKLFGTILAGVLLFLVSRFSNDYLSHVIIILTILLFFWLFIINRVGEKFKLLIASLLKERKGKTHTKFSETNYLHSFELLRKKGNNLIHKHFTYRLIPGFQQAKLLQTNQEHIESIAELMNSSDTNDHILALKKININWDNSYVNFVCSSALSESTPLSKTAIALLSSKKIDKIYIDKYLHSIINPTYSISMFYLLNIGYNYFDAVKKINLNFERDTDTIILRRLQEISLIQILGENNSKVFEDFFLTKIRDTDSEIETHILKSLSKRKLVFTASQKTMLRDKIALEVNYYSYVLASILDLYEITKIEELNMLLYSELKVAKNRIYLMLGLLYDVDQINQIQSALEGDESHEIVLAIEMLEDILDPEIKDFIILVYDRLETRPKYNNLVTFFPQMKMSSIKRLEDIINYDFKRSITLLRIVSIRELGKLCEGTSNAILANVFNKNDIIKKAAYISLFENNKNDYLKYYELENDLNFKEKLTIFNSNQESLSVDKKVELIFNNDFFPGTSKLLLFKIAQLSEVNLNISSEEIILKEIDFVLFIISGQVTLTSTDKRPLITRIGGILGLKNQIYDEKTIGLNFSENIQYLRIPANHLSQILLTEPLLVSSLLNYSPTLRILKMKKTL